MVEARFVVRHWRTSDVERPLNGARRATRNSGPRSRAAAW
jgi:hypothetical protein